MVKFDRIDSTANRLRLAMDEAGKRQVDLVRETGIDKSALSNYLKGRYEPKSDVVYKLAVALNVSEMWLWGYDCKKERTIEQKENDVLADITIRLRTDKAFFNAVSTLYELDANKLESLIALLK